MKPKVSVVMATIAERRNYLPMAMKNFLKQTYSEKELIVVSDDPDGVYPSFPGVKYVVLDTPTTLGKKLNLGINESSGEIIQKFDDDDWYHQDLITRAVEKILEDQTGLGIVHMRAFLTFFLHTFKLHASAATDCQLGSGMAFRREIWEKAPFRECVLTGIDVAFWEDHDKISLATNNHEYLVYLRHGKHLWKEYRGSNIDDLFATRPLHSKQPEEFFGKGDLEFYIQLRKETFGQSA